MKKRIIILGFAFMLCNIQIPAQAAEKTGIETVSRYFDNFIGEVQEKYGIDSLSSITDSVEELVKNISAEDAEKLIKFVKREVEEGNWESQEGIEKAIREGEEEFGVTLSKEQKEQILSVIAKIKKLGLEPDFLIKQAEKIYEDYGKELTENATEAGKEIMEETKEKIKEEVNKSITNYFSDMISNVKSFFKGIFKK